MSKKNIKVADELEIMMEQQKELQRDFTDATIYYNKVREDLKNIQVKTQLLRDKRKNDQIKLEHKIKANIKKFNRNRFKNR